MADKTPVKATFDSAGDADGLSEFVSGDTVPYTHGGTGLSSIGSAGQVIKVNSGADGLEWGAVEAVINIDGMTDKSSITLADTDKIPISDGGTEGYIVPTQIRGYLIKDEDNMASDSATHMPSQQSVKAYADTKATTSNRLDEFANPTSALDINDQELGKAVLKDYAETDVAVTSGTTLAIDLSAGNTGSVTLAHNVTDIDFTNVPTNGTSTFTLKVTQDGTGSRTLSIGKVTVNGGSEAVALTAGNAGVTLSTAANSVDLVTFLFFDAGNPLVNALLDFKNS
jgi:hypothetical protein|nr:hypothetical protein [uncultured Mediterranean phage uvMED]